ncbi:hypothetical protein D3C86_1908600 [compost metagenome]
MAGCSTSGMLNWIEMSRCWRIDSVPMMWSSMSAADEIANFTSAEPPSIGVMRNLCTLHSCSTIAVVSSMP